MLRYSVTKYPPVVLDDPSRWGAVILAGGTAGESLTGATGEPVKGLVTFDGKPSVAYALDACRDAGIGKVALVAGEEIRKRIGALSGLERYAEPGSNNIQSARNGMAEIESDLPLLILPSDSPLISGDHLRGFIHSVSGRLGAMPPDRWFAAGIALKEEVEKRLPGAEYKYVRLKEGRFAAGGLYAASRQGVEAALKQLETASRNRKSQLKLALQVGVLNLCRYCLGLISLTDAERLAGRLLGGEAIIISDSHPFTTMDFDTPEDWSYLVENFERLRLEQN